MVVEAQIIAVNLTLKTVTQASDQLY